MTVLLFAIPQPGTVAWTQYEVDAAGLTVIEVPVWPATGVDVSGAMPWYHWNVMFGPPVANTLKIVEEPCVMVRLTGVALTCGARQLTVTVTALLSAKPHEFVTRTQYDVVD
jgi:hypothetical protein